MTCTALRAAIARFSQFAVRADAGLSVHAPEQPIIACRHGRIGLGNNELAFPPQRWTKVGMIRIEALGFLHHAAPPDAAFKMARFTATRASCTL
jgi:hypothetical protein